MLRSDIFEPLCGLAGKVVGANLDPDDVPLRKALEDRQGHGPDAPLHISYGPVELTYYGYQPWTWGLDLTPTVTLSVVSEKSPTSVDHAPWQIFDELVRLIVRDPYWAPTALADSLEANAVELNRLVTFDKDDLEDADWHIRRTCRNVNDLLLVMYRRLERQALDSGTGAIWFLLRQLPTIEPRRLAQLVAASDSEYFERVRAQLDSDPDIEMPWDEQRAILVSQLIYDLRSSASEEAIVRWFDIPQDRLDGLSPLEALQRMGVHEAAPILRIAARAGRGSIAA